MSVQFSLVRSLCICLKKWERNFCCLPRPRSKILYKSYAYMRCCRVARERLRAATATLSWSVL